MTRCKQSLCCDVRHPCDLYDLYMTSAWPLFPLGRCVTTQVTVSMQTRFWSGMWLRPSWASSPPSSAHHFLTRAPACRWRTLMAANQRALKIWRATAASKVQTNELMFLTVFDCEKQNTKWIKHLRVCNYRKIISDQVWNEFLLPSWG